MSRCRPRRAQPGGDPADVGRQHPDLEEGHVRARHPQPHRDHHGHGDGHQQRAVPHRAEDPGGGAQAHAPQRHLRPHAVTAPTTLCTLLVFRSSVVSSSSQTLLDHRP
ncbi:hypothetical protein HF086_009693 [Spodoptera exigua]|uniref:Uncharacterized protein n=1 Tax=Spodoptera exigua TaxID=7107 RepID=A0A922MTA7_SPOEX|nr:hypothetical protein HF086_009693 [Spodoptera exigua]